MIYQPLGRSRLKVSAIALGCWEMAGNVWGRVEERVCIDTIHRAVAHGVTTVDTAASYGAGRCEEVVGKALKGIRDKVVLMTKCGLHVLPNNDVVCCLTPANIRLEAERSLKRLNSETIDLYQFHYPDPATPIEESLEAMCRLKEEGKILSIGVSNFSLEQLKQALPLGLIDSVQLKFSLLSQELRQSIDYCRAQGVGVITYGSIAGGMLSGAYRQAPIFGENDRRKEFYPFFEEPLFTRARRLVDVLEQIAGQIGRKTAEVAINWVLSQPGVTAALVGAANPAHVEANAAACDFCLTPTQLDRIQAAYHQFLQQER